MIRRLLFGKKVLVRLGVAAVCITAATVLPNLLTSLSGEVDIPTWIFNTVRHLLWIAVVVTVVRLFNALLEGLFRIMSRTRTWRGKPIKGLLQTAQLITFLIGFVLVVSILFNQSPTVVLTGLGASAAIGMLIFRDSILGFVSGIQLSANNMLNVGDWITVPKWAADGVVEEVTLSTVKVRNWDNTITTIPPYLLVSEAFQNWEGMTASGGRRVKRSISIDMSMVTETNLRDYRQHLVDYLHAHPKVNKQMTILVRQLQSDENGLPIELYFFTDTTAWLAYEDILSEVMEHAIATLPQYGLRPLQRSSTSSSPSSSEDSSSSTSSDSQESQE